MCKEINILGEKITREYGVKAVRTRDNKGHITFIFFGLFPPESFPYFPHVFPNNNNDDENKCFLNYHFLSNHEM